ncbi:MAG TPA: hypothetical protein VL048_02955 [Xanthobacteraceae bacterium]|jgi:uncharacterized membrane protein|nr:hypothetical protein [Xanthobacteraceae bacterium]
MAKAADKAAAGDKAVDDQAVAVRPPMISDYGLALTVYVLYLLGFFTGLTAVVGLIIASMQVDRAEPVSRSHFRFQVRTFWIGLLFVFVGVVALHVAIGGLILLWWVVWTLIRCVKGLLALNAGEPIADPESWFFG